MQWNNGMKHKNKEKHQFETIFWVYFFIFFLQLSWHEWHFFVGAVNVVLVLHTHTHTHTVSHTHILKKKKLKTFCCEFYLQQKVFLLIFLIYCNAHFRLEQWECMCRLMSWRPVPMTKVPLSSFHCQCSACSPCCHSDGICRQIVRMSLGGSWAQFQRPSIRKLCVFRFHVSMFHIQGVSMIRLIDWLIDAMIGVYYDI